MPPDARTAPSPHPRRSLAARGLAVGAVALWAGALLVVCAIKGRCFLYTDFDLAIFSQALDGVMHGRWFSSVRGMVWLGDHSSLVLVPLAPLSTLVHPARLLPALQALALALGAWPLFAHARRQLGDERPAAAFAAAWVLQPALAYLALFEFHPEALATSALLAAVVALAADRPRPALAWAFVAALCKEDVALPIAVMGALALLRPGPQRRTGAALLALAAVSLLASFAVLKPLLGHGEAQYGDMYARWGRDPGAILAHIARQPGAAIATLGATPGDAADTLAKRQYWLHLLGPLLGLPLLAPLALLPAAPVIAEHFLSSRIEQHTVVYQYTALVLPFAALAAVDAVAWLGRKNPTARGALPAAVLLAAALAQAAFGPFARTPLARAHAPTESAWPDGRERALAVYRERFDGQLPPTGVVVADFASLAPLATRDSLHSLHHVAAGRYTYSSRPYPAPAHAAALIADFGALDARGEIDDRGLARVRDFVASRGLRVTDAAADLVLLEPGADSIAWLEPRREADRATRIARFDGGLELLAAELPAARVAPGGLLVIETTWRRGAALPGAPLVQWSVTGPDGRTLDEEPRRLGYGLTDVTAWPPGRAFRETYRWIAPVDLAPGEYGLALSVWRHGIDGDVPAASDDPAVRAADGLVEVGRFVVE